MFALACLPSLNFAYFSTNRSAKNHFWRDDVTRIYALGDGTSTTESG
jgi:hypothetical protein